MRRKIGCVDGTASEGGEEFKQEEFMCRYQKGERRKQKIMHMEGI